MPLRALSLVLLCTVTLAACAPAAVPPPEQSGELVVVTRSGPTTYYFDADDQPVGFEHDLVTAFAARRGWKTRFIVADTLEDMVATVEGGRAHLAAAGLTADDRWRARHVFGPTYGEVKVWVACRQAVMPVARIGDLAGLRVEVVAHSPQAEHLRFLAQRETGLDWHAMAVAGAEELLERVDLGMADCALSDSDSLDIARNFHPNLRPAFILQSAQPQAWLLQRGLQLRFEHELAAFFAELQRSGELVRLRERYFGHVTRLREADVAGILERRGTLLRELRPHFHEAQRETGIDWRLLAAVGYQESQWDAHATSPTGVRGLMMLTAQTADHLGVKNRLDARESILGGARYIVMLRDRLPADIAEPDRTWLALAAYNLGMGHVYDARRLARHLGKDADAWLDMKDVLPLLAQPSHAGRLRHGYARGGEARAFVENVRIYYDILNQYEPPYRETDWF